MENERKPAKLLLDNSFILEAKRQVAGAKKRVWITCYDWRWYRDSPEEYIQVFNSTVFLAVRRGIDVRVLCDKKSVAESLRGYGIPANYLQTNKTLHTKAILVDTEALILGSHNLTKRGAGENLECSIVVHDLEPLLQFENYFARMWLHLSTNMKG